MSTSSTRSRDAAARGPVYCVWEITLECDLGCVHCGSRAGDARPNELSTEECLDVVRQLAELGVREVSLIGGEAYLRDDWLEIVRAIAAAGMKPSMTTGARNLTAAMVADAEAAGLRTVSISIDGLQPAHDAQRGRRGSWERAVEAARLVAASTMTLGVNTQINRASLNDLPALADLLVELEAYAWQVQLTVPMGHAADRPELLLQPYDLLEVVPLLVWLKATKLAPAGVMLQPGNNVGYFGPYERFLRVGGLHGAHWQGCTAGHSVIALEADGTVKSCPSLPTTSYGGADVRDVDLGEAMTTERMTALQGRQRDDLWGYCADCYYGDVCLGGCSWTAHCLMGAPGNNPYCIHRAMQFEQRGLREKLVQTERAGGQPFDHGVFELVVEPSESGREPSLVELLERGDAPSSKAVREIASLLQPVR